MNPPKIKICGVSSITIARAAIESGAEYVGLVFHESSTRNLKDLSLAKSIASEVTQLGGQAVGVFMLQSIIEIEKICEITGLKLVQLHGPSAQANHSTLPPCIAKIIAIPVEESGTYCLSQNTLDQLNSERDYLLFDYKSPGSGKKFNHHDFSYHHPIRHFIAGGLAPESIGDVISNTTPYAVDVSSGVESSPGVKSVQLIKHFINQVNHVL